jgi:ABC-type multidrug transport system fused ATPase/permease subunit
VIDAALGAFGGGSVITAVLTILIKVWDRKREDEDRKTLLIAEKAKIDKEALDSVAKRTNNWWGNFSRIWMLIVTDLIFIASIVYGAFHPDAVIWVGQEVPQKSISFMFFEFKWGDTVTWREFNGMVLLPIYFARAGALMSYYLVGGMWSRR